MKHVNLCFEICQKHAIQIVTYDTTDLAEYIDEHSIKISQKL